VKKKCLSTFCGTLAGNWALSRLRSLLENFVAKEVLLSAGRIGLSSRSFFSEEAEW